MRVFRTLSELRTMEGRALGTGDWLDVDQPMIDAFAETTGDHQWIHVDPERAAAGPYGTTIAHGYLTVSLLPRLLRTAYRVDGVKAAVNYGSDRVRLPAPVPAGARIRATAELAGVKDTPAGAQITVKATVEREGGDKPVCVAHVLTLLVV
jgi:acyl dehydratase